MESIKKTSSVANPIFFNPYTMEKNAPKKDHPNQNGKCYCTCPICKRRIPVPKTGIHVTTETNDKRKDRQKSECISNFF